MDQQYYVYIVANRRKGVLYTGITRDLVRRVWQHRNRVDGGFTAKYHCCQLVMYEVFHDSYNARTVTTRVVCQGLVSEASPRLELMTHGIATRPLGRSR